MKKQASVNYGIQANTVTARAIAIGENAQAVATETHAQQLEALSKLAGSIEQLKLDASRQQYLPDQVAKLKLDAEPDKKTNFDKIVSAIKNVGKAAELVAPLRAVAAVFGFPMPA